MGNRVFVGNISFDMDDNELREVFEEFGEVTSAEVIVNKFNGRSKGFGFVEYASQDSVQDAIENLNGQEVKGRRIKVNFATEKSNDGGGGRFNNRNRGRGRGNRDFSNSRDRGPREDRREDFNSSSNSNEFEKPQEKEDSKVETPTPVNEFDEFEEFKVSD